MKYYKLINTKKFTHQYNKCNTKYDVLSARQASGLHFEEIILIQHTLKPRNALQSMPLFEFSIEVLRKRLNHGGRSLWD